VVKAHTAATPTGDGVTVSFRLAPFYRLGISFAKNCPMRDPIHLTR